MKGINGQPVIDLDPHVDVAGFNDLIEECRLGLAKSQWDVCSFGPGIYDKELARDLFALENGIDSHWPGESPHPDATYLREVFNTLSTNQRRIYLKLRYGLYNPGSSVYLRAAQGGHYLDIHRADQAAWTANAKHFPKLVKWIAALPFESYGRAMFFVNEHHCNVVEHSDMHSSPTKKGYVAKHAHKAEFIWIRPNVEHTKSLYVLNEETGERHYVKGSAAWFNSFDVHGADAGPTMTWTLRVDGVFTRELREALTGSPERPQAKSAQAA